MNVHTTQPAIHVYTANRLPGEDFDLLAKHAAIVLSTCNFHDATNISGKLKKGNGSLLSMGEVYE
jgi:galactose mutarotase-like enzyme